MKILIVGAGIAGLAMAKALEIRGLSAEIAERRHSFSTAGHGIFLLGNATRALADLNLLESVDARAYPITAQRILSCRGEILNDVDTRSVWGGCGPCLALPRQALLSVLQQSLARTTIRYDTTVTLTMNRVDKREVFFFDGRVDDYDLVIGADGVRSCLRAASFTQSAPRTLGTACWRMMVDNNGQIDAWTAMLGSKRTLLAIPVSPSQLYLYADCPVSEFGDGSVQVLKKLFSAFEEPLGALITGLDPQTPIHRAGVEEVFAKPYVATRLALIGDAAHASSPSMAQGAGMALEDAVVLADCLAGAISVDDALSRFYHLRKQRVQWVQKQCHARDKLRASPDVLRNLILRKFGTGLYKRSYTPLLSSL
jgi:2-polyprenyl-6-methoxyphenol hydroxylase-like FAD-dependent oxidoreductase